MGLRYATRSPLKNVCRTGRGRNRGEFSKSGTIKYQRIVSKWRRGESKSAFPPLILVGKTLRIYFLARFNNAWRIRREEGGKIWRVNRSKRSTVKSLLIRRSSHCSLNLLFLIILRFPCLLDYYVEKSLPCRGCKGWLNQESPELYIYIYIYTSFQVETRIKIGREEFRGVEDRGKNFRDTQDRTKGWLFRFFARFALVFVAVKLNYLVKKVTYTEIS